MTGPRELYQDMRVQAVLLSVLAKGLCAVRQREDEQDGDPEFVIAAQMALKDQIVATACDLAELFDEAEGLGLMELLARAAEGAVRVEVVGADRHGSMPPKPPKGD